MWRTGNRLLVLFLFWALGSCWLMGQTTISSTILGTVADSQKAVVPGASVTLKNVDTGIEKKSMTGSVGEYNFPNLMAGNYQVEVAKEGFKKSLSEVTPLENGTTLRVDMSLEVGQVTQEITVTAAAPLLHTDDADVNQVIENRVVRDVPIEGRNFLNYAVLSPLFNSGTGDTTRADWGLASATAPGSKVLNLGGTEYGVGYYIDGLNSNDNWVEGPTTNVNMDSVQEVKTEIVNYSAEYGRDVGQLSLTTKSGTNSLHGTAYDFRQVNGLNARDPYTIYEDPARGRDGWHQDQWGFSVGGPVYIPKIFNGKNKAFFFVSLEQLRRRGNTTILAYVPTARERSGDFGEWLERFPGDPSMVIYDPSTFDPATGERQPYTDNIITNVNSRAAEYVSHFPTPNFTSTIAEDIRNWKGNTTTGINNDNFSARFDYTLSSKDTIYFKYSRDSGSKINQGGLIPELALGNGPVHRVNIFNGHWLRTFGATLTNELTVGYLHAYNWPEQPSQIKKFETVPWFRDLVQNVSLPGGGLSDFDKSVLGVEDDGIYALYMGWPFDSLSLGPGEFWYQVIPQLQIADNATKVWGKHTFKMGGHYFRRDERDNDIIRSVGFYSGDFLNGYGYTSRGPGILLPDDTPSLPPDGSGWDYLAEFMTGAVTDMTQRTHNVGGDNSLYFRMPEWAAFFNDTWQASPRLTLNFGLRYELASQGYSLNNFWGVLDKKYEGLRMYMPGLTPGSQNPPYPADKNNFAPRFGFAYRFSDNWVMRGGYGVFYETGRYKFIDQMFFNAPGYGGSYYSSPDYAGINDLDPNEVFFTLDNSFPAAIDVPKGEWPVPLGEKGGVLYPRQDTTTIDENTPIAPYLQRWSLDVERRLKSNMILTASYVGSKGTKLVIADDLNLPPQGVYFDPEEFHLARPNSIANGGAYVDRFGSVNAIHHGGNNAYHALAFKFEKRFSNGLSVLSHYTWSKMTDAFFNTNGYSTSAWNGIGGQWHRDWAHGLSDADHTHRFVTVFTYELPFGNNFKGIARTLAAGWQVNSVAVFESGAPATVFNGDTSSFDYMGDVPIRVCDGNGGSHTFFQYFDTSCFVNPPAGVRGNAGRNIIRLPGINNWDISAFKKFKIGEGKSLDFRWEMFNAFNHPQWSTFANTDWGGVVNDTGTNPLSTFGRISGGRPGRHVQFALKFVF